MHVWQKLDQMGPNAQLYRDIHIPVDLHEQKQLSSTVGPLLCFECVEWHSADRVRRHFGYGQLVPGVPKNLGEDHYIKPTRPQNKDCGSKHEDLVNMWSNEQHERVMTDPNPNVEPNENYSSWYLREYGIHMRLTDRAWQNEEDGEVPQEPPFKLAEH
ncbi:hypothetical protein PIB30_046025 [Stylosanthes scabra]|uniref:Aminotransferase-like plant mobile domain-containing protein n=1 Tax=Stylosanthes scabra TaxID=79078 RepID=A0ABU6YF49_9FABA|nr:hypothetical protein [Stylosanthes scabra]